MSASDSATSADIPVGLGPPTKAELIAHYPAKFSWEQLRTFVNSGDLGLLKRDKALQKRYDTWAIGIKEQYGSIVDYLVNYRLQWGKPDTLSLLQSEVDFAHDFETREEQNGKEDSTIDYFTTSTPNHLISIIQNDWPYSVPAEVEHTLVWTKLPVIHPSLVHPSITARIHQDGIWGFTGSLTPPPPPSALPQSLGALSEWGITMDKLIISPTPTEEEAKHIAHVSHEVHTYVKNRWKESEWETAWFVNPPRLQSVPGLAHIHVFARKKTSTPTK